MRYFKKKALSLILASVLTAASAFCAGQYKDTLSELEFKEVSGNNVDLVLKTDKILDANITPRKIDPETYVIMLSEVDGSSAPTPDVSSVGGYIKNISVRTLPYSDTAKGYTRITIKTFGRTNLTSSNEIFVPSKTTTTQSQPIEPAKPLQMTQKNTDLLQSAKDSAKTDSIKKESPYKDLYGNKGSNKTTLTEQTQDPISKTRPEQADTSLENNSEENVNTTGSSSAVPTKPSVSSTQQIPGQDNTQKYLFLLGVVGIIITCIFLYLKGRDRFENVIGEKLEIEIEDDEEKKKKEKERKNQQSQKGIKSAINKLDSLYPNRSSVNFNTEMNAADETNPDEKIEEKEEPLNIVDLDELFKEQQASSYGTEDDTDALEEFLSGFSFEGLDYTETESTPIYSFDEKTYEEIMSSNIKFSKEDIDCFKELLKSEVNAETMQDLGKYMVSNPIAPVNKNTVGMLESLVTEYSTYRNIVFTGEDIDILRKLMSVEIDRDFIKNLKVDHDRTIQMENDIRAHQTQIKKPSKIMTLKVKGNLPDLSEELKKQGNRPIQYEIKPQTVYFKEGYEYTKLHVTSLPNLEEELKKVDLNTIEHVESETIQNYQDTKYDSLVDVMKVTDKLPDLKDALKNPENYSKTVVEAKADEKALSDSIDNVNFKPFDNESTASEVLNKPDVETKTDEGAIEYPDNEIFDELNYEVGSPDEKPMEKEPSKILPQPETEHRKERSSTRNADELIKRIEAAKTQREQRREELKKAEKIRSLRHKTHEAIVKNDFVKCNLNGQNFDIKSSVSLTDNIGCHFAKSAEGYAVLCYEGNDIRIIKEYKETKSEKIQARLSDTLPDGDKRFLIRIGTNKFVVNINGDKLSFVMDLC